MASRASFIAGDWLEAMAGRFDLILSNPPYLATREIAGLAEEVAAYDPRLALDGGPDGLAAYRRIAARAREALAEEGRLLVEIGPAQSDAVAGILEGAGLRPEETGSVQAGPCGRPRVVVARPVNGAAGRSFGQKRTWRTSMFRLGSCQQMTMRPFRAWEARPVATATRAYFLNLD